MTSTTTKSDLLQGASTASSQLFDDWFDPIETGVRERVRGFIEEMIRSELDAMLLRPRYGRRAKHAQSRWLQTLATKPVAQPIERAA